MARRKKIKNEFRDYVQASIYGTLALDIAFAFSNYYFDTDLDLLLPPTLAFGGLAAIRTLEGIWPTGGVSISSGHRSQGMTIHKNGQPIFASIQRWVGFRPEEKEPVQSRTIRYKEPPTRGEFFWDVSLPNRNLPVRIYESRLFGLVRTAERRQRFGERAPFSRTYFTQVYRPRLRPVQYNACMTILGFCGLVESRGQGASGELLYPPYSTIELAKEWFSPVPTS